MGDGSSEPVVTGEESMNKRASQVNSKLVHELDGETIVIEPWGLDGLRVRVTTGSEILSLSKAI